ncbi:hypothetical protein [Tardiphaga sp. 813_E8_N1_3]|uniref:hypothetical protein n=1 Tax=Tardiphaga sp. 813_E8_N1_3 TaxID=3240760 RepID=UPI003F27F297
MSENTIRTYAELLLNDQRCAVNLVYLPGGARDFERDLIAATTAEVSDAAGLAQLVSLAHAAFVVADTGAEGVAPPWYREIGLRLLRRSMDAMTVIQADRERETSSVH